MRIHAALIAAGLVLAAPVALAQGTGQDGVFNIHNDTSNNILVGFYTMESGQWSNNWLSGPVAPGQVAKAEFFAEGECEIEMQAGWLGTDGGEVLDDPFSINICEASNVYLGDNDISFD